MFEFNYQKHQLSISDPIAMPKASSFLWNKNMMLHMNCRGFANAQFMQPEPSKYAHAPNMEAKTFMQPEQEYFSHHAGRFFYLKCIETNEIISLPYEPVKTPLDKFTFIAGQQNISWHIEHWQLQINIHVSLPTEDSVELWKISIKNQNSVKKTIAIYPYFTIGYMSWMNQSADYNSSINGIIARSITPYQQVADYYRNQHLKDWTFFISKHPCQSWNANQKSIEGEGGLHAPDDLKKHQLSGVQALYETPVACMQFCHQLAPQQCITHEFIFGPANNEQEVITLRNKYLFEDDGFEQAASTYQQYFSKMNNRLQINSPEPDFDEVVNHWLPRQVFYHGDVNRLTTDPQTRNYLQDAMGVSYIAPELCRQAIITAVTQQLSSGAMPDGILLSDKATLKYINLVPHSDHCIWLTICLESYLNTTNDKAILYQPLRFKDSEKAAPLVEHINLAFDFLLAARNEQGLSLIEQGDWCDPMNMVGHKGKGVSAWLTMATSYSLAIWNKICRLYQVNSDYIATYEQEITVLNGAINQYFWHENWYARGITDNKRTFGISTDSEGEIFLNPQAWALLCNAADENQKQGMLRSIKERLLTPYGVMMLSPAYTHMHEDIGRVTQKFPGTAENGSIYNHASAFFAYSLYQENEGSLAFDVIKAMLPSKEDAGKREQMPNFIPNYYRGAYFQIPQMTGKSSQLFNTGTVAWVYRCIIEELCGIVIQAGNVYLTPKLPNTWPNLSIQYTALGAKFNIHYQQDNKYNEITCYLNDQLINDNIIRNVISGSTYNIRILLPVSEDKV
ncbi:NdvB protein [Thalassotalea sp. 1_MG-2023]|uniref:GH36-type glycosyl hydrolase domain-containing protein n=1 Tax=Thalassotalea sp. 1_MG-2023 TaxID=3062680 RepID=UPI0026E2D3FD|nr:NdvB protein [Thalassotalea sp. 1_MG-2023]MDO6428542.1 NdvB protein [Thalassotalea sp. 1_MG-2023]